MTPSLKQILDVYLNNLSNNINVAIPCVVTEVDKTSPLFPYRVNVEPTVKPVDDKHNNFDLPLINNVPVYFPASNAFRMEFQVSVGDMGLLVFCDTDLMNWGQGGGSVPVDAIEGIEHTLNGPVFLPGLNPKYSEVQNTIKHTLAEGMEIKTDQNLKLGAGVNLELNFTGKTELKSDTFELLKTVSDFLQNVDNYLKGDLKDIENDLGVLPAPLPPAPLPTLITALGTMGTTPFSPLASALLSYFTPRMASLVSRRTNITNISVELTKLKALVDAAKL